MAAKSKSGRTPTKSAPAASKAPAVRAGERPPESAARKKASGPNKNASSAAPVEAPVPPPRCEETVPEEQRKFKVVLSAPETAPQTTMGRAIRPFARPAQSGAFSPWALSQARRGR